jgi:hypothetical protein
MGNKLQNIKAIRQMLDGTHKFQTKKSTGFSDAKSSAEKNKKRAVGDKWEEIDPVSGITYVIEQKNGFRVKRAKSSEALQEVRDYLNSFQNCPKETCTCTTPNRLDEKMRIYHQMCFDCVIDMEHKLKLEGKYEEYEQKKLAENKKSWLKSAEQDIRLLKELYTQATTAVTNAHGLTEKIEAKMTPEEFEKTVQQNFEKFKTDFIKNNNINNTNEND